MPDEQREGYLSTDVDLPLYLKPLVKIEPLTCSWYTWPHMLSPANFALNMAYRYLPIMESFVGNPAVHLAANQDPKMFGGPFVALGAEYVPRIRDLIVKTRSDCKAFLELAKQFREFDKRVQQQARGYCLTNTYEAIPTVLKGFVELVYDLNHHPKVKIFEGLLGALRPLAPLQHVLLSPASDAARTFFMSTPRFENESAMDLKWSFDDKRIDTLARTRTTATTMSELSLLLGSAVKRQTIAELFTPTPPSSEGQEYIGEGVRVRYFGHACILLQTRKLNILFDPMVAWEPGPGRYTFSDLPERIDFVIFSHSHQDHFCVELLLQLRHRIGRIIVPTNNEGDISDPSMRQMLNNMGFANVLTFEKFEEHRDENVRIVSLPFPGEHCDLDIHSKHSVYLEFGGRKFLFLVDSDAQDPALYRHFSELLGPVDDIFLGMECHGAPLTWLYSPLLSGAVSRKDDESRRLSGCDSADAQSIVEAIKCSRVFIYAMGQEPWLRHVMGLEYTSDSIQLKESEKFLDYCRSRSLSAKHLRGCDQFIHA